MAIWGRRLLCNLAPGSFCKTAIAPDQSRSRERAAFTHFISAVRFRLSALSSARSIAEEVRGRSSIWDFAGRALTENDYLAVLTFSFLCGLLAGGFLFLGRNWMRAAAFPIAFLIFMVPMPDAMADTLETASQFASAEAANLFFQLSGMPFIRIGRIFQLPNISIEVAQECSGIRSSWVLFITSILAANLFLKTPWRRLVLVAFIIPLGILRNGFRILVIGLLCVNVGPQMIHSIIHRRGGPLFFVLSLIPLFLVLWWLRSGEERRN